MTIQKIITGHILPVASQRVGKCISKVVIIQLTDHHHRNDYLSCFYGTKAGGKNTPQLHKYHVSYLLEAPISK